MGVSHLLGLIVPMVSLLFSVTFCTLWARSKTASYLLPVGLGFGSFAAGFILRQFVLVGHSFLSLLIVSTCYVFAICWIIAAAGQRRQSKQQLKFLASIGFLAVTTTVVAGTLNLDLSYRSVIDTCVLGALFLSGAFHLSKTEGTDILDRILLRVLIGIGITLCVTAMSIFNMPAGLTPANYHSSLYWLLLNVALVVSLLSLAMTLFAMTAVDLMKKIQVAAEEDYLSGLLIRSAFTREVSSLAEGRAPISGVILFDLDHFKHINDTHGHTAGDNVIRAIGHLVRKQAPKHSICGRVGGEEFGIVLPNASLAEARLLAENLRAAIMMLKVEGLAMAPQISASFGVALHNSQNPFEMAYKDADNALYKAKQAGRNRVNLAMKDAA